MQVFVGFINRNTIPFIIIARKVVIQVTYAFFVVIFIFIRMSIIVTEDNEVMKSPIFKKLTLSLSLVKIIVVIHFRIIISAYPNKKV